jgi:hypothetical protein
MRRGKQQCLGKRSPAIGVSTPHHKHRTRAAAVGAEPHRLGTHGGGWDLCGGGSGPHLRTAPRAACGDTQASRTRAQRRAQATDETRTHGAHARATGLASRGDHELDVSPLLRRNVRGPLSATFCGSLHQHFHGNVGRNIVSWNTQNNPTKAGNPDLKSRTRHLRYVRPPSPTKRRKHPWTSFLDSRLWYALHSVLPRFLCLFLESPEVAEFLSPSSSASFPFSSNAHTQVHACKPGPCRSIAVELD